MRLQPISNSSRSLSSATTQAMIFDVRSVDYFIPLLDQSTTWASGFVVSVYGCIGDSPDLFKPFDTAITYTADGLKKAVDVLGVDYVKVYTSTTAGSITVDVRANGERIGGGRV